MVRSWRLVALAVIAAAFFGPAVYAQGQATTAAGREGTDAINPAAVRPEAPESIFNEQVRRYRFDLEGTVVTADTAEAFVVTYRGNRERPPIVGAYADGECNALVVVGPPESEQAIRETLAEWIVARGGIEMPSLKVQRRGLEGRWRVVLSAMAECEVDLVTLTGDRAKQMRDRLQLFETELATLERQLQVMDRFIARLAAGPSAGQ